MGLAGLVSPQPKRRGEEGMCLGNLFPGLEASGPRRSLEPLSLEPLCGKVGSRPQAGPGGRRQLLQCSVGPEPGPATQSRQAAGSGQLGGGREEDQAAAEVTAMGAPACPRQPREALRHLQPSPTVQRRERLLLFGEEAESLLLVFLAEAGIRAGDGGQGQALSLDADALGLVDGGAHTLKPGQHLLLQGGSVRTPHLPGPCEGWGLVPQECPFCRSLEGKCLGSPPPVPLLAGVWAKLPCTYLIFAMEEPFAAIAQPRKTEGFLPCSHLWSPLPGQRAGSDPTVPSQAAQHLLREVKIWTISLPGFKNP